MVSLGDWIKVKLPSWNAPNVMKWYHGIITSVNQDGIKVVYPKATANGFEISESTLDEFICGSNDVEIVDTNLTWITPFQIAACARKHIGFHQDQLPMPAEKFVQYFYNF